MQLIRVTHRRCGDFDGNTFVLAPDEWSRTQAREAIYKAQAAYLDAIETAAKGNVPPNAWRPYGKPEYEKHPDKTVTEVKADWDALAAEYKAWEEKQRKTRKHFENYLKDEGFTLLWDEDAAHQFEVDWGHRHGQGLAYGDDKTDSMPLPVVMAGGEDPEDVW